METTVVYADFAGTVTADVSDHASLDDTLSKFDIDTKRYKAVGVDFYSGLRSFSVSIICIDKDNSTREKTTYIKIPLSSNMKYEDFFIFFKRFKIVMQDRFHYDDIMDEEILTLIIE